MAKRSKPDVPDLAPRIIDPSRRLILPEAVLDALGAKPGDHLGFIIEGRMVKLAKASWRLEG